MNLMQGMLTIAHENKTWSSKLALVKNSRLADLNTPLPQSVPEPSQFSTEPTIPSAVEELGEDLGNSLCDRNAPSWEGLPRGGPQPQS